MARAARLSFFAGLALLVSPLSAQVRPTPGPGSPRLQFVDYAPDQVVLVEGAAGYQTMVELAPDEQVQNVALGDASGWQVSTNRNGNHIFVKAVSGGVSTNMTVVTNVRHYSFELAPATSMGDIAYTVRFRYPSAEPETEDAARNAEGEGLYRLRGARALRPSEMSDDGTHTFIRWPRDRSLPAVYAIADNGKEMLVNGMMREDDVFVIDGVSRRLVFRIDKQVATATRLRPRK